MALTQTQHDIINDTRGLSAVQIDEYFDQKGIDKEKFKSEVLENEEFLNAVKGLPPPPSTKEKPFIAPVRLAGRAVGETVSGFYELGKLFVPEFIDTHIEDLEDRLGESLPKSVKKVGSDLFDPYHGDGFIEPLAADMAAIVLGRSWLGKGAKALKKAKHGLPYRTGSRASMRATTPVAASKGLWTKRKARKARLKKVGQETAAWGGAVTLIHGPEDDILTELIQMYPDAPEIFNALAVDPDNPEIIQYAQAMVNNVLMEGTIGAAYLAGRPLVHNLARRARMLSRSKINVQQTRLSKVHQWARRNFTSRYGVADPILGSGLMRIYAGNRSVSEADGIAQDLMKVVKEESEQAGVSTKSIEDTMNTALGGTGNRDEMAQAIDALNNQGFTRTTVQLARMRNKIDELSTALTKEGGLVTGDLKAIIDSNQGIYLNRAYRLFDDPSFTGWDKLPENVKLGATQYLRNAGVEEDQIEFVLKEILKRGSENDFRQGMKFLSEMSLKSNKPFIPRNEIPPEIRSLMGEIKDPYKNFARTYEKLSVAKAESDFLHDVSKYLLDHKLAVKGVPTPQGVQGAKFQLPAGAVDQGLISLKEVSDTRLSNILGKAAVDKGQGVNPLEDLFVDKNYIQFLKEGIDLMDPTGPIMKQFLKAKALTQTQKTVMSPATHGRNIFGNMILMIANGFNPIKGTDGARKIVWNRLKKMSGEEFGKQVGRYQELGIMDSSVRAQTIKAIASDAFNFEPGTFATKMLDTKAGRAGKKIFEVYQAEDDFFKIMHFEKTKQSMRKWMPDIPEKELEELAAARTRDLMPNYALVPKAVKFLRRSPLSDFAAWPAEITRVSKNLLKYTWDDWSGNTVKDFKRRGYNISDEGAAQLKKQALIRAGGLSAAGMGGDILQNWSMNVMGLGQEDTYNINRLSPRWSQDTAKVFLSPINEDKNGHIGVDFINLGPIDPFSYLKAPSRMLVGHMLSGKPMEDSDLNKVGMAAFANVAGPFLDLSMITEATLAAGVPFTAEGRQQIADDPRGFVKKAYDTIAVPFLPGGWNDFKKQFIDYRQASRAGKELGRGAMSEFGYTMPEVEFTGPGALSRWAGIRPQRLDISAGMRRELLPIVTNINNAAGRFTNAVSDPRGVSQEDSIDAFRKAQLYRLNEFQKLKSITNTYDHLLRDANLRKTGFNNKIDALWHGLTKNEGLAMNPNVLDYMDYARDNYFIPFYPTKAAESATEFYSGANVPWELLFRAGERLEGSKISDDE